MVGWGTKYGPAGRCFSRQPFTLAGNKVAPSDVLSGILQSGLLFWISFLCFLRKCLSLNFYLFIFFGTGLAAVARLSTMGSIPSWKALSIQTSQRELSRHICSYGTWGGGSNQLDFGGKTAPLFIFIQYEYLCFFIDIAIASTVTSQWLHCSSSGHLMIQ